MLGNHLYVYKQMVPRESAEWSQCVLRLIGLDTNSLGAVGPVDDTISADVQA